MELTQDQTYIQQFPASDAATSANMAEAVKDTVNQVVEGVKGLAVAGEKKVEEKAPKAAKPKKEKKKGGDESGRPLMLEPVPAFIDHRVKIL